jgi:hypothetical protein
VYYYTSGYVSPASGVTGNSEVLTKLSRIPSSVENASITTLDIPNFDEVELDCKLSGTPE